MMLLVAACLVMVACNNKPAEVEEPTVDSTEVVTEEPAPCCQMMKDWADFDNKTVEEQTAMVEKRGECITNKLANVNMDEIQCEKAKNELPAFIEKWNKEFAGADLAGKKALIDEFDTFKCLKADKCCKEKEEAACDNKCGKDCKKECCGDKCEGEKCQHNCKK